MAGKKKAISKVAEAVKDAAKRDIAMSRRLDPDRAAKGVKPTTPKKDSVGMMNDYRRPSYGGPGYTGSKALAVIPKKAKPKMGKGKKALIAAGVLAGAGGLGNVAFPSSDKGLSRSVGTKSGSGQAGAWNTGKSGTGRRGAPAPYKPASSSKGSGLSASGRSYTAAKGDSLWSIAEKTVPKGASVSSWWAAIKKMNTKNGKLRRLYTGTGVSLPPGARRS